MKHTLAMLSVGLAIHGAAGHNIHACRAPLLQSRAAVVMQVPEEVESLLPILKKADLRKAEANWEALRPCYATEEAAIEAVRKLVAIVLPYGANCEQRVQCITGSYKVLQDKLEDEAEVQLIIAKNPGVLGCVPAQLETASADDVRRAASVADGFDNVFGGARRFLQSTSWWDEGLERPGANKWFSEAAPLEEDDDEEEDDRVEFVLPELNVDGQTFMYDEKGEYNGVEHILFTLDGEPWGLYDPVTKTKEQCAFVEDDDE